MSKSPPEYGPGGAHSLSNKAIPFEEAVKHQLELNAAAREIPGSIAAREQERIEAIRRKEREKKAKRRARNPYDFS